MLALRNAVNSNARDYISDRDWKGVRPEVLCNSGLTDKRGWGTTGAKSVVGGQPHVLATTPARQCV